MANSQPTERELDLLKILWEEQHATVREIYEALHAQDTQLAYTTVLSLLQTMERKGLVGHAAEGKAQKIQLRAGGREQEIALVAPAIEGRMQLRHR